MGTSKNFSFSSFPYKISRYFANIAMKEFSETNGWKSAILSEYPIIIYSTHSDNQPRYYEFRVLVDNTEVGAVTCRQLLCYT